MRFVALGVRGSTPAPGADFLGYGGHTSCLAIYADGDDSPRLVLDAGTGLRALPRLTGGAPYRGELVLTHLHWDHVQGLPFCPVVDHPGARVRLHVPVPAAGVAAETVLAGSMAPPHFPIGPRGLLGDWRFEPLLPGRLDDTVAVAAMPHKGGAAYGIRVEMDGVALAYLPDHALHAGTDAAAIAAAEEFVRDVDVLVHDGQYVEAEQAIAAAYGHATVESAIALADRANAGSLLLTHHAPGRTDAQLDALAARYWRTPGDRPIAFVQQDRAYRLYPATVPG
jgi:ribonuclease BN (tRNA processing enzyme)